VITSKNKINKTAARSAVFLWKAYRLRIDE